MDRLIADADRICGGAGCRADVDGGAIVNLVAGMGAIIFIFVLIGLALLGFWVWMLVDALQRSEESYKEIGSGEKTIWLLVMIISLFLSLYWLSAPIYFFVIRKRAQELESKKN